MYLPLYSYRTKEVELKSGLNAWNAAPKNKNSSTLRPLNEVYIPIPLEFHKKYPDFFCPDVFEIQRRQKIMLVVLRINLKSGFICIYQTVRKFPLYLLKAI